MRIAVLADIHSNLDALRAVLGTLDECDFDQLVVLGDIVGYNARPNECVQLVRERADTVVVGNHDVDAFAGAPVIGTHSEARMAQHWTRAQLSTEAASYLVELPRIAIEPGEFVAVHGCYLNDRHYTGYVTSTMLRANLVAIANNDQWPQLAFCGHTHSPMLGWATDEEPLENDLEQQVTWPQDAPAVLVNPGSVGQPRDGDPRAAFALVDTDARSVDVRRVEYDLQAAHQAVLDAGLPAQLAQRLMEGR